MYEKQFTRNQRSIESLRSLVERTKQTTQKMPYAARSGAYKFGTGFTEDFHYNAYYSRVKDISDIQKRIDKLENRNIRVEKVLGKYKTLAFGQSAARWGLRAGKAVGLVGALALTWDITKLTMRPLGEAIMLGAENLATEYQNRFMPELGGRLKMTYLSQGAATERQRAVQAMSKAYINGRSAFGTEAQSYH